MRQLTADEWQLGPFSDVAILSRTMESLAKDHGFTPERVIEDGLGWVSYVPLALNDGTRFLLDWGETGTPDQVIVQADITDRPYAAAVDKLLAALGLDRFDVLWQSDDDGYEHQIELLRRKGKL